MRNVAWPAILGFASVLLTSCSSTPPARFFRLRPLEAAPEMYDAPPGALLGVGPIALAPYLDRPQIVVQDGAQTILVSEFDHWAEPLEANVTRVIADNLARFLRTDRVVTYPWFPGEQPSHRILVDVQRLDGRLGGECVLIARFEVRHGDDVSSGRRVVTEPARGESIEDMVAAMERALGTLCREIAASFPS